MRPLTFPSKLLLGCAVATVVVAGVAFAVWPREARYDGKPLSYWLDQLPATLMWTNVPYSILTTNSYKQFLSSRDAANKAVDALGPDNLPKLVERLRTRDTSITRLRHALHATAVRFGVCKLSWQIDTSWFRRGQAVYALCRLGNRARPIIPELVGLAKHNPDPGVQRDALEVLRHLSPVHYAQITGQTNLVSATASSTK